MDTRAVVPPQPRGDGKVHKEAPRRNQRAALSDRTNVQAGQVTRVEIKGKPPLQINRPLRRRFHAQLLSNDDQKSNVKKVLGVVDQAAQNRKCAPTRNVTEKATNEEKEKPVNISKPVQGPRKDVKAFTSTLTARSKAMACGVANKPKEQIVDCSYVFRFCGSACCNRASSGRNQGIGSLGGLFQGVFGFWLSARHGEKANE